MTTAGRSILEMLWERLDDEVDSYATTKDPGQRGVCTGLAVAIAIVTAPYEPNVDSVRKEAARRLKSRKAQL